MTELMQVWLRICSWRAKVWAVRAARMKARVEASIEKLKDRGR